MTHEAKKIASAMRSAVCGEEHAVSRFEEEVSCADGREHSGGEPAAHARDPRRRKDGGIEQHVCVLSPEDRLQWQPDEKRRRNGHRGDPVRTQRRASHRPDCTAAVQPSSRCGKMSSIELTSSPPPPTFARQCRRRLPTVALAKVGLLNQLRASVGKPIFAHACRRARHSTRAKSVSH